MSDLNNLLLRSSYGRQTPENVQTQSSGHFPVFMSENGLAVSFCWVKVDLWSWCVQVGSQSVINGFVVCCALALFLVMLVNALRHPEASYTNFLCSLPGSSSQFLSELEALWAARCTILKLYWALGFNWDRSGYHAAARQLAGPEGGGIGEQTGESLTAPAPSVWVVMNSYLGLEGCSAGILTVFL